MAKAIKSQVKIQLPAGKANPAPPVGTVLGPHGINLMEFCKQFNEATRDKGDSVIPCIVTIYEDRSFSLVFKKPPVSDMIKKAINIQKGSKDPLREKIGKLSRIQVRQIAEAKMEDLNALDIEAASKIVAGTARSMGIEVEK
ncbi:MAG: 50S ribosomal protein L11 [Candidatus Doudnabacteria bacterium RIFCSPHIGHO2_01_FULL_50_11]|uniref:Large ribosomal subunit protein uL11 n=1 Tax=Candidatus Doudnabacteria bacterium RIFCSPHIGHO2_01_FULL_50_11 TaxID=1817828 RepID=A0A1F5PML2_9BACT|nr:MAG: 50S ribosomal protein L11 [Candidatus Doudnabacteria bacterium RIFCSPHIGHO2_01_FULL_50_11]HLC44334.1 50S ribosomal protein L11 [Patescibacteria group bacterium]